MRFTLAPRIEFDLEDIFEWTAHDSPSRAVEMVNTIEAAFRTIAQHPQHYQLRPEIGPGARLAVVGRYVVLFHTLRKAWSVRARGAWRAGSAGAVCTGPLEN